MYLYSIQCPSIDQYFLAQGLGVGHVPIFVNSFNNNRCCTYKKSSFEPYFVGSILIELTTYLDVQCTLNIKASGLEVASVADSRCVVKLCYDSKNNNIASNLKMRFANKNDPRGNAECLRLGERERGYD